MCAAARADVASCPLFDFVAWSSLQSKPGLLFTAGGSARFGYRPLCDADILLSYSLFARFVYNNYQRCQLTALSNTGGLICLMFLVAFLQNFFRSINVSITVVVSQGIWKVLQWNAAALQRAATSGRCPCSDQ